MRKGLLLNGFVLALLAAVTAAASFVMEPSGVSVSVEAWDKGGLEWDQPLDVTTDQTLRLNGRDSLTLLSGTSATAHFDEESQLISVELNKGSVIFSTLADDFSVEVNTPFARVSSQHSTAVVQLAEDAQTLTVFAVEHPSLVTFLNDSKELNALNVPSAYRMKIPASKVSALLAKLRLTKLTKEFPVFPLTDGDLDEASTTVLTSVQSAYDASAAAFLQSIQNQSDFGPALSGVGGTVYSTYKSFRDALTVLPTAEEHLQELRTQDALIFAMTNALYGDASVAQMWLDQWSSADLDPAEVRALYASLFSVLPGDALYPVKSAAAQILYPHEDPLTLLRRQYGQIEGLLDRASQVEAQQAYLDYQAQFETALDSGAFDDPSSLSDISREYTLLELMLRSNAVFYSTDSTQLLSDLEGKIIALAGSSQDLDEERQSFIQSKLRFLDKLFSFVQDKKVNVDTATDLANELIFEANTYMDSLTTQVAVTDYFKTQLEQDEISIQYINSPEFYTADSFEEGLAAFKAKQADLTELNAYIQSIRSGHEETATVTEDAAQQEVEDELYTHGIQFSKVVSLGDASYRLFTIEGARSAGYGFEAKYDRETQILYDVVIGDVRFSTGLKLEDARDLIEKAMVSQNSPEEDTETETSVTTETGSSLTDSVALNLVESQFEEVGLKTENFVFTVVDLKENTFTFEGTLTVANVRASGSYDADTQKVSEIVWDLGGTPQTLPDADLADFEATLYGTYLALSSAQ